jgi:hypothetical protein
MKDLRYASETRKRIAAAATNGCPTPPAADAGAASDAGAK